jgi:hypothetical protein
MALFVADAGSADAEKEEKGASGPPKLSERPRLE